MSASCGSLPLHSEKSNLQTPFPLSSNHSDMKPSIPKGTRDFLPAQILRRQYIFDTIRHIFIKYGYLPIGTPVMENLSTLMGKYGEEGDKLLFKVLNNGDYLADADAESLAMRDSARLIPSISKRGLRYDLTVPFARFVVMHQNEITFPFKRYAIEPVWRADRPQKGRYQEFYQCDVDVVGSSALMYEAELVQIYDEVFHRLGLKVVIRINNRKMLAGMAEVAGCAERFSDMTIAIDKLDKVGIAGVKEEMLARGIAPESVGTMARIIGTESLEDFKNILSTSEAGSQGMAEVETVFRYLEAGRLQSKVRFDITLARGLNYYTGCIFEVGVDAAAHPTVRMGSLGGGGRYDDLTGIFGMPGISGVGISFGADRIYDVMEELQLFPGANPDNLQVLLLAFDESTHLHSFLLLTQMRTAGINADLYPEPGKLKKQMSYANSIGVPNVVVVGSNEMETGMLTLKNMLTGQQESLPLAAIIDKLKAAAQ
jgi:histidyl-tRNA synthetase